MNTQILEDAIKAGFTLQAETQQIYMEFGGGFRYDITENLSRFAYLIKSCANDIPEGYVLAKIEPDNEMKVKGAEALDIKPSQASSVYKAMIESVLNPQKAST